MTPDNWTCIDGTVYLDEDKAFLIFSHSFEDLIDGTSAADGDFCIIELSLDLSHSIGNPQKLFSAKDAPWARPVPFAKIEFGIEEECYFSDGPSIIKCNDSNLYMIFSSWGENGYAVGVAKSESNDIHGSWKMQETPLFPENGGHGMFFKDFNGNLMVTLHYPNDRFKEHPCFWKVNEKNGKLSLC